MNWVLNIRNPSTNYLKQRRIKHHWNLELRLIEKKKCFLLGDLVGFYFGDHGGILFQVKTIFFFDLKNHPLCKCYPNR
jgi:hypothetical protein